MEKLQCSMKIIKLFKNNNNNSNENKVLSKLL